jgi:hypothetical protein
MNKQFKIHFFLIFFPLFVLSGESNIAKLQGLNLLRNNISPSKGMLGFSVGASVPIGGNGQVLSATKDFPHSDYGVLAGLDFWKRNINAFDFHVGLIGKYQQYHFHYTPENSEELSGYFQLFYYSLPFSFHIPIPKFPYFQFLGGAALSSMNFIKSYQSNISDFVYTSSIDLNWIVMPELFVGLNFLEEKSDFFILRGSIVYSAFPLRNQDYDISMSNGTDSFSSRRAMPSGKFEVLLTLYPKWKFKRGVSKNDAINCPAPF